MLWRFVLAMYNIILHNPNGDFYTLNRPVIVTFLTDIVEI